MEDLTKLKRDYDALLKELQNPELISDYQRFQELSKKKAKLEKSCKKHKN